MTFSIASGTGTGKREMIQNAALDEKEGQDTIKRLGTWDASCMGERQSSTSDMAPNKLLCVLVGKGQKEQVWFRSSDDSRQKGNRSSGATTGGDG